MFKKKVVLLTGDMAIIVGACLLAAVARLGVVAGRGYIMEQAFPLGMAGMGFLPFFYIADLYNPRKDFRTLELLFAVILCSLLSLIIAGFVTYGYRLSMPGRWVFGLYGILVMVGITSWRIIYSYLTEHILLKTLIIGVEESQRRLLNDVKNEKRLGVKVLGFIQEGPSDNLSNIEGVPILGEEESLEKIIAEKGVQQLILKDRLKIPPSLIDPLTRLLLKNVKELDILRFYQENWQKVPLEFISQERLFQEILDRYPLPPYHERAKRLMDITLGILGLILTLPLFIPIAIAIKLDSEGPLFYRQERLGKEGKPFKTIKFRSMIKAAETDNTPVYAEKDDKRITRLGRFLRNTRLDEVPQLINVILGQMSLVGPRPERKYFVIQYLGTAPEEGSGQKAQGIMGDEYQEIPLYAMRLLIKPGITGWAQVNYGYVNSPEGSRDKLEYDLYYILNQSLFLDFRILLKTIRVVLLGKGM